jgi:hypothetical protein
MAAPRATSSLLRALRAPSPRLSICRAAPRRAAVGVCSVRTFAVSASRAGLVNGKKNEGELGVGELEGAEGAMAPIVRVGEDEGTMRARLVCESAQPLPQ